MTDSSAWTSSTAKFDDSDSLERAMALPTVEESGAFETERAVVAASDDSLRNTQLGPHVVGIERGRICLAGESW